MTPNFEEITGLATRVVAAEANHDKLSAALAAAEEARDAIAARLTDAVGRQRAIGLRRVEGGVEDTDIEELGTLAADIAGLETLLSRHDGLVAEARGPVEVAAGAMSAAKTLLQRAERRAAEEAVTARLQALGDAMLGALRQARQLRDANGGGLLAWRPSEILWAALVPVFHGRHW